ncbi:MAG TPA: hypothetical protein VNE39_18285 [Planctomycetota bacterium]|nr:hypothetical protein [Planctomycetota bacterium]
MTQQRRRRWPRLRGIGFVGALAAACLAAAGDDYSEKDFGLRLASAFIRFTEVSVAGGQTVANRLSSAINPASVAWTPLPFKWGVIPAGYYSQVDLDNGTRVHVSGESVTWDTKRWGVIQPTLSQIRANRETTRQGLVFNYDVDIAQVQWGKRWGDWAFGVALNYARANVAFDMPTPVGKLRVSDTDAKSYRVRLGALHKPADKWLLGLVMEYGTAPYRGTAIAMTPFGPIPVKLEGTQQQAILRPGVSYEYAPLSTAYFDYQLGHYWSERGTLNHHLFTAGVDHRLLQPLFVRAAVSADARGNVATTVGIGVFFSRYASLDLSCHRHPLPELRPEFGQADVVQAVFNVRF